MLITVSGMVGSGKSTAVKQIAARLSAAGVDCQCIRFRYLRLLPFGPSASASRPLETESVRPTAVPLPRPEPRGSGFRPARLTVWIACGYLARIFAFRLLGPRTSPRQCLVVDRFFYDSLVHYSLNTQLQRIYAGILRRMIPTPDLAVLLLASSETIAARRPDYAPEYVTAAGRGYDRLAAEFPKLVTVRTDPGTAGRTLDEVLSDHLSRWGMDRERENDRPSVEIC
jgi:thymidylate kinase